jgi:hypothetical protein
VFLADLERRASLPSVAGHALLVECADPDVASRLTQDKKMKHLCVVANNGTIIVPAEMGPSLQASGEGAGLSSALRYSGV